MKKLTGKSVVQRRAGTMLLSTVVSMTVAAMLMGVAILGLHFLLTAHGDLREHAWFATGQQRLASHFRRDCHASVRGEFVDGRLLLVDHGGGEVEYACKGHEVLRVWRGASGAGSDRFLLPPGGTCQLALDGDRGQLSVTRPRRPSRRPQPGSERRFVVRATLGQAALVPAVTGGQP